MTRTHAILFSLLFLCLQSQAQSQAYYSIPFLSNPSVETPTINAYSGKSGDIDIRKDAYGFYVEADFAYNNFWGGPKKPEPNPYPYGTGKMMVSLSNSETTATSTCLNFSEYNYTGYNWNYNMWETTVSYPSFKARSLAGHGYINLDRKYWGISSTTLFLTKQNACETNASLIGSDRYGVLGLGTDKNKDNFWTSKNFSVYIKPDLSAGKLLFMNDTSNYTSSSEPAYKLPADVNWQLSVPRGYIKVKDYSAAFENRNAIFDIHSDAIGLPSNLFQLFINNFVLIPGIYCSSDLYKPDCNFTGSVQNLPDITLSFNDTKIIIPPKVYATPNETFNSSNFKLNFKATSPDLSGPSYVTPAFKDSIILGTPFMSYYFTVFDGTKDSNMISLYLSATGNNPNPTPTPNRWIIIGAVVLVFLVIIGCCLKKKVAADKLTTKITKEESHAYNYTSYN